MAATSPLRLLDPEAHAALRTLALAVLASAGLLALSHLAAL